MFPNSNKFHNKFSTLSDGWFTASRKLVSKVGKHEFVYKSQTRKERCGNKNYEQNRFIFELGAKETIGIIKNH